MFPSTACVHILLLSGIALSASGLQKVTVTLDRGTAINISGNQVKDCRVCTGDRRTHCSTSLLLQDSSAVSVEFECSKPQDVFSVEILRNIECDTKSCSSRIVQGDSRSSPFLDFNRTYTWKLRAPSPKAFRIDFAGAGLRQISASEICPDRHSYTLRALQTTGNVALGKYCTKGPISSAQILTRGSFSVDVPAGQKLQNGQFDVSIGEEIKSLAKISLTLPEWDSTSELFSPNYPESFPDDDVMEWYFEVSDGRRVSLRPLQLSEPRCLKKEAALEYHGRGRVAQTVRLSDPQPEQSRGSFSLTLRNCEMDRARAGAPGLALHLSVTSRSSQASCQVDVSKLNGLSLHLEQMTPAQSDCVMTVNSSPERNVTIASNSLLSFSRCLPGDIRVTASRVVACAQLRDCPKTGSRLSLPSLPSCLPSPLSSVTWRLRPPPHGTVEVSCPMGSLQQALPLQPCNATIAFHIAEEDGGTAVGRFCSQGSIQKILIHTNVSVTVSGSLVEALRRTSKPVLDVRMKEEISERYIFTVSPKRDVPVLVATPGWPMGMKDYSTVSWIVSVPERMEARLKFINTSQPKCSTRHTNIRVQRMGRLEEDYSRREDEEAEGEICVSQSFYLNMSNCMTESGHFSVLTKITLQKSTNFLLTTILSVVAALLVVFIIVLVVVCVVIRKKKKKMLTHQVSIYNPNGTSFLPGPNGFPQKSGDTDEHEYASIDDTLVYTHLLRSGQEVGVYGQIDEYRSFPGHSDSRRPLVSRGAEDREAGAQRTPSAQQVPPLPTRPLSHGLVDNAIYQTQDQEEEDRSPTLGPRMEPEGGN